MAIWKTDKNGDHINLESATTKREFRVFDLSDLRVELEDLRAMMRKFVSRSEVSALKKIEARLMEVIAEKEMK